MFMKEQDYVLLKHTINKNKNVTTRTFKQRTFLSVFKNAFQFTSVQGTQ